MTTKHELGQYFTTDLTLKEKVLEFILNNPDNILEPSIGRGDLVEFVTSHRPNIVFDMYEIDNTIQLLDKIMRDDVFYTDFMNQPIVKKYKTIIGNPPYVRTKKGNLYIDFTERCYDLLDIDGELIFIVPSDFLKLTSAASLLNKMMTNGTFTHIYHPHNEKLFEGASIDVIVFRYCKNDTLEKKVILNDKPLYITNSDGLITFGNVGTENCTLIGNHFDVYVGMVTGKEDVYKNASLGNIDVINGDGKSFKYIYIENYPTDNDALNEYLNSHKEKLIKRKIRKFNESNWFEWGAPRNVKAINDNLGKDCIYIYNLTRNKNIAFAGKVGYFGGGLIMILPKKELDLTGVVSYLNSDTFKNNFMYSGRFKIGHRQIKNSYIPNEFLM